RGGHQPVHVDRRRRPRRPTAGAGGDVDGRARCAARPAARRGRRSRALAGPARGLPRLPRPRPHRVPPRPATPGGRRGPPPPPAPGTGTTPAPQAPAGPRRVIDTPPPGVTEYAADLAPRPGPAAGKPPPLIGFDDVVGPLTREAADLLGLSTDVVVLPGTVVS